MSPVKSLHIDFLDNLALKITVWFDNAMIDCNVGYNYDHIKMNRAFTYLG